MLGASLRWSSIITGTSVMPRRRAASKRPWPAMTTSSAPISTGLTKPNSAIEAAIYATCSSECVRALPANGMSRSTGLVSILRSMRDFRVVRTGRLRTMRTRALKVRTRISCLSLAVSRAFAPPAYGFRPGKTYRLRPDAVWITLVAAECGGLHSKSCARQGLANRCVRC
jgi:hypothetical protein